MQLKIKSRVDADGNLHLQVPKNLANQELDVIIIYQGSDLKTDKPILIAEMTKTNETQEFMKLAETGFQEWNDPEEDIYNNETEN